MGDPEYEFQLPSGWGLRDRYLSAPVTDPEFDVVLSEKKAPGLHRNPYPPKTYSRGKNPKGLVTIAFGLDDILYRLWKGAWGRKRAGSSLAQSVAQLHASDLAPGRHIREKKCQLTVPIPLISAWGNIFLPGRGI